MKRLLLFLIVLSICSPITIAQTTWTGSGTNTNWNNTDNWDTTSIPTATDDVIIPSGFTVTINVTASVQSIEVQGTSTVEINSDLLFTNASSFALGTTINWNSNSIRNGTLTNFGTINLFSTNAKALDNATLHNEGIINISSNGDLRINDSVLNNQATGTLDLQVDNGNITWSSGTSPIINNSGIIKRTTSTGDVNIVALLNNSGTISVESGTLSLTNSIGKNLTGGTYNVFPMANFDWQGNVILLGTLQGTIDGNLTITNDFFVNAATTATFDFMGSGNVNWNSSTLDGGGTLINKSILNLTSTNNKAIANNTTFTNEGTLNIVDAGDLLLNDATFNNDASGTIDMQADNGNITWSSGVIHVINNTGIIKRTTTMGDANIVVELNNNDGIIQVESGTLSFTNAIGKNLTDGTYNVFSGANFDWQGNVILLGTLEGTIDGDVNITNNFFVNSTTTAIFDFTGAGNINWNSSTLDGGGTLVNKGTLTLTTANTKSITANSILRNEGIIHIADSGDLHLNDATLDNTVSGTIDIQEDSGNISWSGGSSHILNNQGTLKKSISTGEAQIHVLLNNTGTISVETGTLSFQNSIGKNLTNGTYNVSSGAIFDWDNIVTLSGTISGAIDGTLNINNNFFVTNGDQATLNFSGNGDINWNSSSLRGGGTLTNQSTLNLTTANNKSVLDDSILNNEAMVNITSLGDLLIVDGTVNNLASGTIDMQINAGNISWSGGATHILNNAGLIKCSIPSGEVQIHVLLNNTGTINVESGTLSFQNSIGKNLTNGTYNVSTGAIFDWDNIVTLSGTINGAIDGTLNINNNFFVTNGDQATLNFSGNGDTNWNSSSLRGGGTLTNQSTLNLTTTNNKSVLDDCILNNEATMNITSSGDLWIVDGTVNNLASGTIDMQANAGNISWSGGATHILNNAGLIIRTTSTGLAQIFVETNNSGIIDVASGELEHTGSLGFTNETAGTVKGIGVFDVPTTYTNNGTFAPGASPGILTVQGNYTSSNSSVLDVELDGLTQGTEYDLLAVQGNGNFDGRVNISMGFEAAINDEFIVATTTGTITSCTLASPEIVQYDGKEYTFSVACRNNNEVVLTITDKTDIEPPVVVTQNITVQLDASGNATITSSQIDNGSTDNCTLQANLVLALDITNFTCADLGDNTVTLTVTDEENNSGTETATVTVQDMSNPTAITQNITVQLDASGNATITPAQIDNNSTDNCTVASLSLDVTSFSCANLGDNTVTLTVTDQSGNSDTETATVTVQDMSNPTAITQNITVQLDASGNATITPAQIDNNSSDNCTVANLSLDVTSFTCANLGDNTVTLTVTDQSGNSDTETATVTVQDMSNPTAITQNITVQLDALGNATITPAQIDNNSSDNCAVANLSLDVTSFTCANLGDNTVTLTVTDQSGNSDTETATVTVQDMSNPTAITQNITVQLDASGNATITPAQIDNNSSDNCAVANLSLDVTSFTCANLGDNTVTLTVTDQSGNSGTETATVTVEDMINPTINCPMNMREEQASSFTLPDYYVLGSVTATDNCAVASVVQTPVPGTVLPDGVYTINFTVTDTSGNTNTCSFELTVEDTTLSTVDNELSEILLFPNPVIDQLTLRNTSTVQLLNIIISDINGKVIQEIPVNNNHIDTLIPMHKYPSGLYFVRIISENGSSTKRILKQ